ncbi:Uncharacterized conserved protein YndB, AHSA1/START domain [Tardiphaga sp. OK246]|nr:Uncharacterized conserved protein YndB, AHSA1/START domain [Tardiphaga sp. OK246]
MNHALEKTTPSTIRLHRVIAAKPEKLYRAFLEPDAVASWLPPYGFTCTVDELDAKVGGHHRMSFWNFTTGGSHSFGGTYLELVPGERLVYTDRFDDPNLPGEMKVTVMLKAVSVGTEVNIEQQGVPDVIPAEAWYLGWRWHSSPRDSMADVSVCLLIRRDPFLAEFQGRWMLGSDYPASQIHPAPLRRGEAK